MSDNILLKDLKGTFIKSPLINLKVEYYYEWSKEVRLMVEKHSNIVLMITNLRNKSIIYDCDKQINKLKEYNLI